MAYICLLFLAFCILWWLLSNYHRSARPCFWPLVHGSITEENWEQQALEACHTYRIPRKLKNVFVSSVESGIKMKNSTTPSSFPISSRTLLSIHATIVSLGLIISQIQLRYVLRSRSPFQALVSRQQALHKTFNDQNRGAPKVYILSARLQTKIRLTAVPGIQWAFIGYTFLVLHIWTGWLG